MKVPFILLFVVGLLSADEVPIYEAEEGGNLTLSWASPFQMNLSELHMTCLSEDELGTLLMYMFRGVQKHQEGQFSGRVQCDRDVLEQGQVRLFLTHLTTLDSGQYLCDMAANPNPDKGGWDFITVERFKLVVAPKSPVFIIPYGDKNVLSPAALMTEHDPGIAAGVMVGTLLAALFFMVGVMFMMRQVFTNR